MKSVLETQAVADVLAERERQVVREQYTPEHDDNHEVGELATAAACYAANAGGHVWIGGWPGEVWPWSREWWKPTTPRRDLVKAAALIIAEIERLDRAAGLCIDEGCPHAGTAHVCVEVEAPAARPMTEQDARDRIELLANEIDGNEEENREMQREIDELYARIDAGEFAK